MSEIGSTTLPCSSPMMFFSSSGNSTVPLPYANR